MLWCLSWITDNCWTWKQLSHRFILTHLHFFPLVHSIYFFLISFFLSLMFPLLGSFIHSGLLLLSFCLFSFKLTTSYVLVEIFLSLFCAPPFSFPALLLPLTSCFLSRRFLSLPSFVFLFSSYLSKFYPLLLFVITSVSSLPPLTFLPLIFRSFSIITTNAQSCMIN